MKYPYAQRKRINSLATRYLHSYDGLIETKDLNQLIISLKEDYNVSVVLIEHDMSLVMDISDRINVINQGRPLASGTPDEIRRNDDVIKAYLGEA